MPQGYLEQLWEKANAPLLPEEHFSNSVGNFGYEALRSQTSPLNLALLLASGGAGVAGRAGMLGISRGARAAEALVSSLMGAEGVKNAVTADSAGGVAGGLLEAAGGALGARGAFKHAFPVGKVADAYMATKGLTHVPAAAKPIDEALAMRTADAFQNAAHAPHDPAVAASYRSLIDETSKQFDFLKNRAGVKIEKWKPTGNPAIDDLGNYPTGSDMLADVKKNNRLTYFPTETGFGPEASNAAGHPLLATGKHGIPLNDEFRAVHDYFGHGVTKTQFSPEGEYQAWLEHSQMFPQDALGALSMETRGQNTWQHFGPHMRDAEDALIRPGAPGFLTRPERPYAQQKANVLPLDLILQALKQR